MCIPRIIASAPMRFFLASSDSSFAASSSMSSSPAVKCCKSVVKKLSLTWYCRRRRLIRISPFFCTGSTRSVFPPNTIDEGRTSLHLASTSNSQVRWTIASSSVPSVAGRDSANQTSSEVRLMSKKPPRRKTAINRCGTTTGTRPGKRSLTQSISWVRQGYPSIPYSFWNLVASALAEIPTGSHWEDAMTWDSKQFMSVLRRIVAGSSSDSSSELESSSLSSESSSESSSSSIGSCPVINRDSRRPPMFFEMSLASVRISVQSVAYTNMSLS
mmetsp:Transcript_18665/g.38448  ORF Transcript_18665/g.38448 Transcript_18665/m.38448 type:complete len:272 (-) Transcript_18665:1417-2232(-)